MNFANQMKFFVFDNTVKFTAANLTAQFTVCHGSLAKLTPFRKLHLAQKETTFKIYV